MAGTNPTGDGTPKCLTTHSEDERDQSAVLRQVLEHHPSALALDELIREMTGGGRSRQFSDRDAIERAVRELSAAGLLHPLGDEEFVQPTRAAVRYFELSEGAA
jgi:hypothetical protein